MASSMQRLSSPCTRGVSPSTQGVPPVVPSRRQQLRDCLRAPAMSGGANPLGELPSNDPEDLFKGIPIKEGLIARRMMQKKAEQDKDFAKAMMAASDELRKEALMRRETRRVPENHQELVEYFLNTMAEDLEYEVSRYRPRLTPDFFTYLDNVLGEFRFQQEPDEERIAELDLLRDYLTQALAALDRCVELTSSAKDRLKKLLTSKDKKEMILEMAAANEIDVALMQLLEQNIQAAKAAEQEDAAKFMEKVKQACQKYAILTPAQQALMPQAPAQLGARAQGVPLLNQGEAQEGSQDAAAPKKEPRKPSTRGGVILAPGQEPTPTSKLII